MATQIYVNLPVKDLNRTVDFFTKLGFSFNPQFTDDNATCMIIGENIYAMLLVEKFFKTFINKDITDTSKSVEVITAISVDSRAQVEDMYNKAIAAGATSHRDADDHGWMYSRSFQDLDGHHWEVLYADEAALAAQGGQP